MQVAARFRADLRVAREQVIARVPALGPDGGELRSGLPDYPEIRSKVRAFGTRADELRTTATSRPCSSNAERW